MSAEAKSEQADVIRACAIAREIEDFDLLIEDMEAELGPDWGGLNFENAPAILTSDLGKNLEFVAIAVDQRDEEDLTAVANVIRIAKEEKINVVLVLTWKQ